MIVKEQMPRWAKEILIDETEYIIKLLTLNSFSNALKEHSLDDSEIKIIKEGISKLKKVISNNHLTQNRLQLH